jgi:tetratricopeptide (TPR) repeat protein
MTLRAPIKKALRTTTAPASVARMWGRIQARGRPPAGVRPRGALHRGWALAAVLALTLATAAAARLRHAGGGTAVPLRVEQAVQAEDVVAPSNTLGDIRSDTRALQAVPQAIGEASRSVPAPPPARPLQTYAAESIVAAPQRSAVAPGVPGTPPATASDGAPAGGAPGRAETWRELAARGDNRQAYAELGAAGVAAAAQSASVEDLFALADVARLSGHPAEAIDPLSRIVRDHPSDPRAPLAALTRGRIELRSLAAPAAAARSLEAAASMGVPAGLTQDAYALLVEAYARSGERAKARAAYARLVALFPDSDKAAKLRPFLSDP